MTDQGSNASPLVSIVMPVKDGAEYISQAIDSLLKQTLTDFELIVIDDGSKDRTAQIVKAYSDPRITFYSQENQGVSKAANRGFALAKGQYITRHDHDDISLPSRLETQIAFLRDHPACGLVGTWAQIWVGSTPTNRVHRHPCSTGEIAFALLFNAPFVNTSCIFTREVLEWTGGYAESPDRMPPEDYEFFSRVAQRFAMANINQNLVIYRELPHSQSSAIRSHEDRKQSIFVSHLATFSAENIAWVNSLSLPNADASNFGCLVHNYPSTLHLPIRLDNMMQLLSNAAKIISTRFPTHSIAESLKERQRFLRYQYHTYMGNTYHWARLQYLLLNRPAHENWGSVMRLVRRSLGLNTLSHD
jgi:glycosyltransferase involved in cell wall biosynthesis